MGTAIVPSWGSRRVSLSSSCQPTLRRSQRPRKLVSFEEGKQEQVEGERPWGKVGPQNLSDSYVEYETALQGILVNPQICSEACLIWKNNGEDVHRAVSDSGCHFLSLNSRMTLQFLSKSSSTEALLLLVFCRIISQPTTGFGKLIVE